MWNVHGPYIDTLIHGFISCFFSVSCNFRLMCTTSVAATTCTNFRDTQTQCSALRSTLPHQRYWSLFSTFLILNQKGFSWFLWVTDQCKLCGDLFMFHKLTTIRQSHILFSYQRLTRFYPPLSKPDYSCSSTTLCLQICQAGLCSAQASKYYFPNSGEQIRFWTNRWFNSKYQLFM